MTFDAGTAVAVASMLFAAGTAWGVVFRLPAEVKSMRADMKDLRDELRSELRALPTPDAMAAVRADIERHEIAIQTLHRHEGHQDRILAEISERIRLTRGDSE